MIPYLRGAAAVARGDLVGRHEVVAETAEDRALAEAARRSAEVCRAIRGGR
jgi:hypothetical protein